MKKGKYEVFKVGKEKIISESREKIIEYAKDKGVENIDYIMSFDNIEGLEKKEYKKI